ncbi:hypothetical protein CHUAL_013438 [Chamberlinius hualienensis]
MLNQRNEIRRQEADKYLSKLDDVMSKEWHNRQLKSDLNVLVIVKTMDRTSLNDNPSTGYFTQTVTALDREIHKVTNDFRVGYVTCNIDQYPKLYEEARVMDKYYVSFVKHTNYTPNDFITTRREIEKQDYIFCLQISTQFRAKYVLMIEDDTVPYENVFSYLQDVVQNRLERRLVRGDYIVENSTKNEWAFVKLYYPERWAGYSREISSICELIGIGALTGSLCVFVGHLIRRHKLLYFHLCAGFCLGILIALAVGRQHLLQIRRINSKFLLLSEAPGCCTPAVFYLANQINSIVDFLTNVTCNEDYGVDIALDDYAKQMSLKKYLVQPNLFHHRGVYSTLTKPKNYAEFLFDS